MPNDNQGDQTALNNWNLSDLSRRKLLAGISGGVGAGAILGGGATWALLKDQETLENNELVHGELDLKAVWQQTYNGNPVNAFPDEDGDGVQDEIRTREEIATDAGLPVDSPSVEKTFRNQFADLPDDVAAPVIDFDDVKSGDEGSISFGLHLFDNPGIVRMQGTLLENLENGMNEPERDNIDMNSGNVGELADVIQAEILDENGNSLVAGSLRDMLFVLSSCRTLLGSFENSTTHPLELNWQVPEDTQLGVQTDSVKFNLSFNGEQLRHNQQSVQAGSHLDVSKKVRRFENKDDEEPEKDFDDNGDQVAAQDGEFAEFRLTVENTSDSDDLICILMDFDPDDAGGTDHPPHDVYVDSDDGFIKPSEGCLEFVDHVIEGNQDGGNTTIIFPGPGNFESIHNTARIRIDPLEAGEEWNLFVGFEMHTFDYCEDITCTSTVTSTNDGQKEVVDATVTF